MGAMAAAALTACASLHPTPYSAVDASGYGYKIEKKEAAQIAEFFGNKDTQPLRAYVYTVLAAYDECGKTNKLAIVSKSVDESKEVNYTQVNSNTNYYMTPRGHYVPYTTTTSYPVSLTYPRYGVAFECRDHLNSMSGEPKTQNISRELVSPITKDFKGGVMLAFEKEAKPVGLNDDDLLVNIGKDRVETSEQFYEAVDKAKIGDVEVRVIRNNELKTTKAKINDATATLREVESKSIDLLCNAIGNEVDEFKGIPAAERAKAATSTGPKAKTTDSMSAEEKLDKQLSEDLCTRLRGLAILKK